MIGPRAVSWRPHRAVDARLGRLLPESLTWMQHRSVRHSNHEMFRLVVALDGGQGRGKTGVLFGDKYPMLTADRALARLDDLGLDDYTPTLVLSRYASRVSWL
jgi:hypothetical protein